MHRRPRSGGLHIADGRSSDFAATDTGGLPGVKTVPVAMLARTDNGGSQQRDCTGLSPVSLLITHV